MQVIIHGSGKIIVFDISDSILFWIHPCSESEASILASKLKSIKEENKTLYNTHVLLMSLMK